MASNNFLIGVGMSSIFSRWRFYCVAGPIAGYKPSVADAFGLATFFASAEFLHERPLRFSLSEIFNMKKSRWRCRRLLFCWYVF